MRTEQGLPIPSLEQYRPNDDLALKVAHMMGDQEIIDSRKTQRKVYAEVPKHIVGRVIDNIKEKLLRRPQPKVEGLGDTAQKIANGKRKEPLF